MTDRLQKMLASRGVASRRRAEELIAAGRVQVNGKVSQLGAVVDAKTDEILLDGKPILDQPRLYIALHKPRGYISSMNDRKQPSVLDLVEAVAPVFPVGRLDKETSGLLLLTNDGDWANLVGHPSYGVEKEYLALVRGVPSPQALDALRNEMKLEELTLNSPEEVTLLKRMRNQALLRIIVVEGKKRQIRLMTAHVGHPVIDLRRIRVGGVELGQLAVGEWRHLETSEIVSMREHAKPRT